jgi:deoxycytidine triphosphate deaminase
MTDKVVTADEVISTPVETAEDRDTHARMKAHFDAQPKRRIRCKNDEFVQVNGYTFLIKANEWVMVPEDIAALLEDAGLI